MNGDSARNIIKQIEEMEKVLMQTRENIDNGRGSIDLANITIEEVWIGAGRIRASLSNLDKELERLENAVDRKKAIQLSSQKL